MKKIFIILAFALAATIGLSAQVYSLPFNQDFENGIQGWGIYDTPCGLVSDASQAHSGNWCYEFCGWTEGSTGSNCVFLNTPWLGYLNTDTVQVTFYARGGANISIMRWDNPNSNYSTFSWEQNTTQQWQYYSVAVPTGGSTIMFYSNATASLPLYIDDIIITAVEHDVVNNDSTVFSRLTPEGQLLYYRITGSNTVSVVRPDWDSYSELAGDLVVPQTVQRQGSNYNVTVIDNGAFESCYNLTSVILPPSLDSIKDIAFFNCPSLSAANIPDSVVYIGVQAFSYCGLTSIHIPASVEDMASNVFSGCSSVGSITVDAANTHYTAVDNVLFNASMTELYFYAPLKPDTHYDIPSTVVFVQTFFDCDNLTTVTIPSSTSTFYGFRDCDGLTTIDIPYTLTYFGGAPYCASLMSVNVATENPNYYDINGVLFVTYDQMGTGLMTYPIAKPATAFVIPDSVTYIAQAAFAGCTNLESVTIPSSVEMILGEAFANCTSILSLDVPSTVTDIQYNAFRDVFNINYHGTATYEDWNLYWGAKHINITFYSDDSIYYTSEAKDTVIGCHPQLHSANLPESVRVINDSAFFNLDNLSSVSLPDGLENIGKMAFAWNQGITEVSLPRGLQHIGDNAFWWDTNLAVINFNADNCQVMSPSTASDGNYWPVFIGCDNVTTINIGENVTRIPDRAFSYCSKLRGTLVIPDAVTYIGTSAFYHWYENWEADNDTLQVVLGSGLTEIGDYAFGCPRSQLSSVISRAAVPPTIYEQTFYRYGPEYTPVLWVPCGSTQAYRTAQHWNRIEDIREDCDGIENPSEENNMKVYSISGNIVVTNAPDEIVTIYDMMGRVVLSSSITNENVHLPMPSAGVYMVKIGSLPAQKVVVMR